MKPICGRFLSRIERARPYFRMTSVGWQAAGRSSSLSYAHPDRDRSRLRDAVSSRTDPPGGKLFHWAFGVPSRITAPFPIGLEQPRTTRRKTPQEERYFASQVVLEY